MQGLLRPQVSLLAYQRVVARFEAYKSEQNTAELPNKVLVKPSDLDIAALSLCTWREALFYTARPS